MLSNISSWLKLNIFKFPALFTLLPFVLGVLISYYLIQFKFDLSKEIYIAIQITLLVIVFIIYRKYKVNSSFYFAFLLILLIFGYIRFNYYYNHVSNHSVSKIVNEMDGKTIKLFGYINEEPDENDNRIRFLVSTDSIALYNKSLLINGKVMVSIYKNKFSQMTPLKLEYGDYVEIIGNLEELPHRRNPGEFDYGEYLKLHDIECTFTSFGYEKIKIIGKTDPNFYKKYILLPIKKYSLNTIDKNMGGDEGEFMKGLVLGERSNLSKEIKEYFVNDGISHIIAVSGLNVAYMIIIVTLFLQLLPLNNISKIIIIILTLIFYMNLTGNVPSIIRATIMACTFLVSLLIERKNVSINVIAFSALIILIIDPRQLFDAGFILSYWALLSIIIIYPRLDKIVKVKLYFLNNTNDTIIQKGINAFRIMILGTLAAQIGTVPITAIMFKKISLVSLFTNLVAIPISNIVMAMGFIMIIVSLLSGWASYLISLTSAFALNLLLKFIQFFANLNFSFIETYNADILFLSCFYLIIIGLFFIPNIRIISRFVIMILIILNYFVFTTITHKNENIILSYLDVGNSNACLITTPSEYTVMINSGSSTNSYFSAESNIIPYLKLNKIKQVDLLIISILNKEEFVNLLKFVKSFPIKRIVMPSFYKVLLDDDNYKKYFSNVRIEYIENSRFLNNTGDIKFYLNILNSTDRTLDISAIYGHQQFIFKENSVTDSSFQDYSFTNENIKTAVLKVPASGSFNLISPELIVRTNAQNILISSRSEKKKFNSDIFKETLTNNGFKVLETSQKGAIIFESNGRETKTVDWN